ncbi:MAG TPA: endopeptidase La [Chloroflexi bacterium]|nr:endopeptidase La [Chloroflexota bacterium]
MLLPLVKKNEEENVIHHQDGHLSALPVLPLRNVVSYPHALLPLAVGLPRSVQLLEDALDGDRLIVLLAMTDPTVEEPGSEGVYQIGTVAQIERALRLEDDTYQIVVHGLTRVKVSRWIADEPYLKAEVDILPEGKAEEAEIEALRRELLAVARRLVSFMPQVPEGVVDMLAQIKDPTMLLYMLASNIQLQVEEAQKILEAENVAEQMQALLQIMRHELEVTEIGQQIREEAQSEMEKTQRDYYLRQQLKAIQKELGEDENDSEAENYEQKIEEANLPEEARKEAERELSRLSQLSPQSAEAGVIKTYLDWLTDLPWSTLSDDNLDLTHAEVVLNEDHYGLEKVKERILEFLAVRKLRLERGVEDEEEENGTTILCFVGPPGVGKTSLGRSIARALGRKFTRMSLGGMRDEAEIRGHRRTYIGAMPGRIIQALKRVETRNPVFMLDEVDKIGNSWRGDPASALLEVLDPKQNYAFRDHYLDVDFDLSDVFFITTANTLSTIPAPLRDRMEVIEIDGYTEYDKVQIAQGFLVPRQIRANGLEENEARFTEDGIRTIIREHTREAGVRNLEREIGRALRKVATEIATCDTACDVEIDADKAREFLGKARYRDEAQLRTEIPGVAIGLAWTPTGGQVLFVEARVMEGKNNLILTGQLGDVMKESARIALSYVQGKLEALGLPAQQLEDKVIHLHVPAGAIPKDGPSAGVTLVTALVSELTQRSVHGDVGMTGEVTLQGQVLPVGGIKQKVLAAHRQGLKKIVLPQANEVDLDDVPEEIREELSFILVEHLDDVLEAAITPKLTFETAEENGMEDVLGNNGPLRPVAESIMCN